MLVDGKVIAADIIRETSNMVTHLSHAPHAIVVTCAPQFETKKYLALKLKRAKEAGIALSVVEFAQSTTTEELVTSIARFTMQTDAIVVQLPLPPHIDTTAVLAAIPASYDADGMHFETVISTVYSPVVGAIAEIGKRHDVLFAGSHVVVVGHGRLVGLPAASFARGQGARVTVLTEDSTDTEAVLLTADILILGAGVPKHIKPSMLKDGVVIFDAGTSEEGGVLVGDADPACAEKASLFTPVPGGIGPITVAVLLRNIALLAGAK